MIHPFLDGEAETIDVNAAIKLLTAADAPELVVERLQPEAPKTGDTIEVFVRSQSPLGESVRLEYQIGEGEWQPVADGHVTLRAYESGPMSIQLRATDSKGRTSKTVTKSWLVTRGPRPDLRIGGVSPELPYSGDKLTVNLTSPTDDPELVFEYRCGEESMWQRAENGVVEIDSLARGKLDLQFRCIGRTRQPSEVISRSWEIQSRCDIPLDLSVAKTVPAEPIIGEPLTVFLTTERPAPRLLYQYRVAPNPIWHKAPDGVFKVDNLKPGEVIMQFRVADLDCADHTTSEYYRIQVTKNRFEVRGVSYSDERLIVEITDNWSGKTHHVGASDQFDDHSVVSILLAKKQVLVRSPSQGYVKISIPVQSVESLAKQRLVTPRHNTRHRSERFIP